MASLRPNDAAAPFKVLIIGGSYSGLAAALNLSDLCRGQKARGGGDDVNTCTTPIHVAITVVDERDGFYNVIGSPLAFASLEYAQKAWAPYKDIPALQAHSDVTTIQGSVTHVDLAAKTAKVQTAAALRTLDYDFLVVASGLRRVFPVVPQSVNKADYLVELAPHVQAVSTAKDGVLVVGGGAVGIEMAAELKYIHPEVKVTLAHSRAKLLSSEALDDVVAIKTLAMLREQGVEVLLEHRLQETRPVAGAADVSEVVFTNGDTLRVNRVIMALSKNTPTTSYLPAEAVNDEGYVKIQSNLFFPESVPNADSALAIGDTVQWSGIKRCGRAMHQGFYAAVNIHQRLQQLVFGTAPAFLTLNPIPPMIAIAVGNDTIAYINGEDAPQTGPDVAARFFGDDLGFSICWKYIGLDKE